MASKFSMHKVKHLMSNNGFAKQFATGTVTGWLSGFTASIVGKTVAFGVGSGILLFEVAQHHGYTKNNWDSVKDYATTQACRMSSDQGGNFSKVRNFALKNKTFTAGFVGGFLIGLSK